MHRHALAPYLIFLSKDTGHSRQFFACAPEIDFAITPAALNILFPITTSLIQYGMTAFFLTEMIASRNVEQRDIKGGAHPARV